MPITFGELVQEVINEVRAREEAFVVAKKQGERIKELEAQVAELKKAKEEHKCEIVRQPDIVKPNLKSISDKGD